MTEDFTPITSKEQLDQIMTDRLDRAIRAAQSEREYARKWEKRCKQNASDIETWRREARKWEERAKANLAVVRAHERTIQSFIDKLDDVLNED